ncbi:MAG: AraC family transcriptional regulator, partial [Verrucomicrobiota bacterium]
SKLIDLQYPVWPIHDLSALGSLFLELGKLSRHPEPAHVVDRVDRVAERIILETRLERSHSLPQDPWILSIANQMDSSPATKWNFDQIARKHGCSMATFRRRWAES